MPNLLDTMHTLTGLTIPEALAALDDELPANAYKEITGGQAGAAGLTDIRPPYLWATLERLFGPVGIGWRYTIELLNTTLEDKVSQKGRAFQETGVYVRAEAQYRYIDNAGETVWSEPFVNYGGSTNETPEWAHKGAVTNALGACWSMMNWQWSVYVGQRSHKDFSRGASPRPAQRQSAAAPAQRSTPPAQRATSDSDLGSIVVRGGTKHPGKTFAEIWAEDKGYFTHWAATEKNNNDWLRERAVAFVAEMEGGEQKTLNEEAHDQAAPNTGHTDLEFEFLEALALIMPIEEAKEQLRLGQEAGKADAAWLKKSIAYAKRQAEANPFGGD